MRFRSVAFFAAILIAASILAIVRNNDEKPSDSAPVPEAITGHDHGGSVQVGVSSPPELVDQGQGGDALRQLVLPVLFDAYADGTWRPSLVEPKSDHTSPDGLSATFQFRRGVQWSDGRPITVDDLRRTVDSRFVVSVDNPDAKGVVKVEFKQRLPGWRMLWSATPIAPPAENVFGGPFVVKSVTSGFETVLERNPSWYLAGRDHAPFLDEIRLQLISDPTLGREMLAAGTLDVVMPAPNTVRTKQLRAIAGVDVSVESRTNAWTGVRLSSKLLRPDVRTTFLSNVPRKEIVGALLADEASVVESFSGGAQWKDPRPSAGVGLDKASIRFSASHTEPLSQSLGRSITRVAEHDGGTVATEITDVESIRKMLDDGSFDAVLEVEPESPTFCWSCSFAAVDQELARRADAGDQLAVQDLQVKLRDEGLLLPLWKPNAVVASRKAAVSGVTANGYTPTRLSSAARWWKP